MRSTPRSPGSCSNEHLAEDDRSKLEAWLRTYVAQVFNSLVYICTDQPDIEVYRPGVNMAGKVKKSGRRQQRRPRLSDINEVVQLGAAWGRHFCIRLGVSGSVGKGSSRLIRACARYRTSGGRITKRIGPGLADRFPASSGLRPIGSTKTNSTATSCRGMWWCGRSGSGRSVPRRRHGDSPHL